MNRFITSILIAAICFTLFPYTVLGASPALGNTAYKLNNGMPVKIGYLGGSITVGTGASTPAASWREKTTKWLKDTYPDSAIEEINAGIGGFGSVPNAFRAKSQLLNQNPDLVFVEAAVNDWNVNESDVKDAMEGVVRQIYTANPQTDIVFVYTMHKEGAMASYEQGGVMKTVQWHQQIAAHYGIPSINCGLDLYNTIKNGELTWEAALKDGTHPTDAGYAIYTKSITNFIENELKTDIKNLQNHILPTKISNTCYDTADIIDGWDMVIDGFEKSENSMGGRHPRTIVSEKKGATASVAFSGRAVGLYWMKTRDAGNVEWWVDNGAPTVLSGCDELALKGSDRGTYTMLATNLSEGAHTLNLRVTGDKGEGSIGAWVRIGGIFVASRSVTAKIEIPTANTGLASGKYGKLFEKIGIIFEPAGENEVKRGEMAVAVATMLNIEPQLWTKQTFADVDSTNSAYASVNYLSELGVLSGKGGNFNPNDAITLQQAVKILVSSGGYAPLAESKGGFPLGYMNVGASMGIFEHVDLSKGATPKVIETMLYDTLSANVFDATSFGTETNYKVQKGYTILNKYHNMYEDEGVVNALWYVALGGYALVAKNEVGIGERQLETEQDYSDYLGQNVQYYYQDEGGTQTLVTILKSVNTEVTAIASADIANFYDNTYTILQAGDKTKKYKIYPYTDIIYNNEKVELQKSYMLPKNGVVELIDNNKSGDIDVVRITDYTTIVVGGVDAEDGIIYDMAVPGRTFEMSTDSFKITNTSNVEMNLNDILKYDVISLVKSPNGKFTAGKLSRMYVNNTVSEIITEGNRRAMIIDGVKYQVSSDFTGAENIKAGNKLMVYLDYAENVVYCTSNMPGSSGYGYLIQTKAFSDILGNIAQMKILKTDGKMNIFSTKETIFINDTKYMGGQAIEQALGSYKGVINYKLNEQGDVAMVYTAVSASGGVNTGLYCENTAGANLYYRAPVMNFGGKHVMKGSTIVFVIPGYSTQDKDYRVTDGASMKGGDYYTVAGYRTDPQKLNCDFLVWYDDGGDYARYTTPLTLVEKKVKTLNEEGEVSYKIIGYSKGIKVEYVAAQSALFDGVTEGDIIRCKNSQAGSVAKAPQVVYDYETRKLLVAIGSGTASTPWVIQGSVLKIDEDIFTLCTGVNPAEAKESDTYIFTFNAKKSVVEYDGEKVTNLTKNDVRDYYTSGNLGTKLVGVFNYGDMEELIIYK